MQSLQSNVQKEFILQVGVPRAGARRKQLTNCFFSEVAWSLWAAVFSLGETYWIMPQSVSMMLQLVRGEGLE